ncbi:MAG: carboxypeptidase regulatory-like domain-containing protein [Bryobacteraceae bacterium]
MRLLRILLGWTAPLLMCTCECAEPVDEKLQLRILDSSGAAVSGASVSLVCSGAETQLDTYSDETGLATLPPLPPSICTATVSAERFEPHVERLEVKPHLTPLEIQLRPRPSRTEIVVASGPGAIETSPTVAAGTISRERLDRIPLFNRATGFTDILTRTTPGVAADSNGFAHPLGEHADTSISLDGQPITDQQAKVFANQINPDTIESLTAITGGPPAEFGGKTSLVVNVMTKSGLGSKPSGFLQTETGNFGTWNESGGWANGGREWGNFLAVSASRSTRFLDSPEFSAIHDAGNNGALFDRVDWHPGDNDLLRLNFSLGRSWFQTPNSYDANALGQDQRSQIRNGNLSGGWTHVFRPEWVMSVTPFYRRDRAQYFPSRNLFADNPATLAQDRVLANGGLRADTQYTAKRYALKLGGTYWRTRLHEQFSVGLTDPLFNAPCVDGSGSAVGDTTLKSSHDCAGLGLNANPDFLERLLPFDLSRDGTLYQFDKAASVKETAFYAQGEIRFHGLILSPGLRYDIYNGLSRGRQLQPRFGIAWQVPSVRTLLRASYARLYETPYNENLIFANESAQAGEKANPFGNYRSEPVRPGKRNQFNLGLQQRLGRHLSVDADYYWKFTDGAFDFDTLFNTPITFSVAWKKSKIDGLAVRVDLLDTHGLTAYSVMGHVRSRFFPPQVGGLIFNEVPGHGVFRIDHGEEFEHTTYVRYEKPLRSGKYRPWVAGSWRFNSGLALPDTIPVYTDALALTADQQSQMGLSCGTSFATPQHRISNCSEAEFGASRVRVPALGTANDDHNPVRVARRTLLDLSMGEDRLLKMEKVTVGFQFSIMNLTNRVALYNFLSTFSGTHFVPPRTYLAGLRFSF